MRFKLFQTTVKGQVVDAETGDPLIGAAVMVEGTSQGTVTDLDGKFALSIAPNATLLFKYVGFKDLKKKVIQKGSSVDLGIVKLEQEAVMLNDVTITSSIAISRKTPVAVSTVDPVFISEKLGTQEFPEILKSTPGVYASKDNGGFGESRVTVRGFGTSNVGVMILAWMETSREEVGSSRMMNLGLQHSARAMETSCFSPPPMELGDLYMKSAGSSTISRISRILSSISFLGTTLCTFSGRLRMLRNTIISR